MLNLYKYDFMKSYFLTVDKDNYAHAGAAAVTTRGFNKDCISSNIGSIVQEIEDEGNYKSCTIGTTTRVAIIITAILQTLLKWRKSKPLNNTLIYTNHIPDGINKNMKDKENSKNAEQIPEMKTNKRHSYQICPNYVINLIKREPGLTWFYSYSAFKKTLDCVTCKRSEPNE